MVRLEQRPKGSPPGRRRRWTALAGVGVTAVSLVVGLTASEGSSATVTPSAAQDYDLTGSDYCTADTGLAIAAADRNLISNPGAEYATTRGNVPGGAGTTSGSTVPDPDGVLLPDCWELTSTIAGSDPANEIASAVTASYPGSSGTRNFYGGKSANDKAATGTVTTATQTISLSPLGNVDGKPFALTGSMGGYANQNDNTTVTAVFEDSTGGRLGAASLGPVLAIDRGDISSEVPRSAYGTVPAGAAQVVLTLTFTMGGGGNNDASADNLSLVIGSSAVPPTPQAYDQTGGCPNPAKVANGTNLISNPGAEDYTQVAIPYATGGSVTDAGLESATVALPDCWVSRDDLPAPDAVVKSYETTPTSYPGVDGSRLFFGGTSSSATVPNPPSGYKVGVQGTTTTATQVIDVSSLSPGGHSFRFSGLLGGYGTQGDFAQASVTFEDADGVSIGSAQLGPITESQRVAAADYLAYLAHQYAAKDPTANSGLLPTQTFGTVPGGTAKVLVTISFTAISTGNDSNGIADDLNFTIDPADDGAQGQSYDLTTGTHGGIENCPTADQVTPALDTNLIANPGAEDYASGVWFGAPGDAAITLPDCWVSSSALPAPGATAESRAQSSSSYPPAREGSRVFWGGTNPYGGIAGVSTKATQAIELASLGDLDGKPFKLSALLGGYATQNDNAVVTVTFTDGDGAALGQASVGPVLAGGRGRVSSLAPQTWYGEIPAGTSRAVVTIVMTAVSTGNDNNGEADDLSLTIGDSARPTGPILQTMSYTAAAGSDTGTHVDPGSGAVVPNLVEGSLYRPAGVSANDGVVYASNTGDNVVAALEKGDTRVIAGSLEGYGDNGDGGQAIDATLYQPAGTAVDAQGNIFIADSGDNVVREITPDGVIKRFAGTGVAGDGKVGTHPATSTQLNHPEAVAVRPNGDVYIADTYNNRVIRVTPSGQVSAVAGTGVAGYTGDRGRAVAASLNVPTGLAFDAKGNLYIADSANNVIRRVDPKDGLITTVAGKHAAGRLTDGLGGFSGDGGQAIKAELNDPQGVAVDGHGDLFIADTFNNAIRMVAPDGTISTVVNSAGPNGASPAAGGESSGQVPTASRLNTPYAVAIDPSNNVLYIADTKNSAIAEVLNVAKPGTAAGPTAY
jgi:sugar lactone lactonase YvrE